MFRRLSCLASMAACCWVAVGELEIKLPSASDVATAPTFSSDTPIVATHYFYWYRWPSEHFFNDDDRRQSAHRLHFRDAKAVTYESTEWHARQMSDLVAAGIDVALLVYWGTPNQYEHPETAFSVRGVPPLLAALDKLTESRGSPTPKLGLFYDTTSLSGGLAYREKGRGNADLRTEEGRDLFYRTVRDFFSLVPARHWACIDGRPIVQLYEGAFAAGMDQRVIDETYERFARDFAGRRPLIIGGPSWPLKTDLATGWGASMLGPMGAGRVVQIGPGYDDAAVPGRATPTRDRARGAYYELSWLVALQQRPTLVILETWNEMHEGTGLCETIEDGRTYIDLTRRYVERLRSGWAPTGDDWSATTRRLFLHSQSKSTGRQFASRLALQLSVDASGRVAEEGLALCHNHDGLFETAEVEGRRCLRTKASADPVRYLYLDVADAYYYDHSGVLRVTFEYFDAGTQPILIQFDSTAETGELLDRYQQAEQRVVRSDSKTWKIATIALEGVRAVNRENGGADLRFVSPNADLSLATISVSKLPADYAP